MAPLNPGPHPPGRPARAAPHGDRGRALRASSSGAADSGGCYAKGGAAIFEAVVAAGENLGDLDAHDLFAAHEAVEARLEEEGVLGVGEGREGRGLRGDVPWVFGVRVALSKLGSGRLRCGVV